MRRSIMIVPGLMIALAVPAFAQQTYKTDQQMREQAESSASPTPADPAKQSNNPAERKSTNAEGAKKMKQEGK
jgi:ABC-type transporter MlaC component